VNKDGLTDIYQTEHTKAIETIVSDDLEMQHVFAIEKFTV